MRAADCAAGWAAGWMCCVLGWARLWLASSPLAQTNHATALPPHLPPLPLLCSQELAQLVKQVVNPDAVIEFRENTADDPSRRKPDITKLRTKYGWEPKVKLADGLALMVDDFKARLHLDE